MYEIILHSQVVASRQNQVLQILAGVTSMQPVRILEQNLVYQQLKSAEAAATTKKGAPNQSVTPQRLRYHKLVRDGQSNELANEWKLVIEETPDAGIKDVNARTVSERTLSAEQLERFRPGSEWYKFITQYATEGFRFVHGNVVIRLIRMLRLTNQPVDGNPVDAPAPDRKDLEVVDRSGSYVIEAYVHTEDGPSPALREKATEELLKFARTLEGAIDLRAINRLALDTVVKGS